MPEAQATPIHALRGLAVLAESPSREHGAVVEALGLPAVPTAAEYSDLFLFQLYPYASVHLGPEGMMGGVARDRIAGFWRALGLTPPAEPDHLAALLGLYASVAERASTTEVIGSDHGGDVGSSEAERALLVQAACALLEEHLAPWVFGWLDRVEELAGGTYRAWAGMLSGVLRAEVDRLQDEAAHRRDVDDPAAATAPDDARAGRPGEQLQHLREVPDLADPRSDGTDAFLAGLLAPVVSGMIVTRADLAHMARSLDAGLRAGERRYALEHLLAQDASGTLLSLAAEAERQGDRHGQRTSWQGSSAVYFQERCARTAGICRELAAGGVS